MYHIVYITSLNTYVKTNIQLYIKKIPYYKHNQVELNLIMKSIFF